MRKFQRMRKVAVLIAMRRAAFVFLIVAGCGPTLHPVEGDVMLDGVPIADAGVLFHPKAGGPVAFANTDKNGRFRLSSANKPGLLAGEYQVAISKQKIIGMVKVTAEGLEDSIMPQPKAQFIIPEIYSKAETSGLSATVPSLTYRFELKK